MLPVTEQYRHLKHFLGIYNPFVIQGFDSLNNAISYLKNECHVLVLGAGGLGCEILKCLVLSGFGLITVVDCDFIELTNLNRQLLFKEEHIGKSKAVIAAEVLNKKFKFLNINVTGHHARLEELSLQFISRFNLIISGLDTVNSRRWINAAIHELVQYDVNRRKPDVGTITPLFDGGTEGLKGQARVILPTITSCFECSLETFPTVTSYPFCTLIGAPRLPEHCIQYALEVEWEREKAEDSTLDCVDSIKWIHEKAVARAEQFQIPGVTYELTYQVVHNIIPAVVSTNAAIAAILVQEAFKISTYSAPILNNYCMYMGDDSVYTHTFEFGKLKDCSVCCQQKLD